MMQKYWRLEFAIRKYLLAILYITMLISAPSLHALELKIDQASTFLPVDRHFEFYVDDTGLATLEQVSHPSFAKFRKAAEDIEVFKTRFGVVWARFRLSNHSDKPMNAIVYFAFPHFETLRIYQFLGDGIHTETVGVGQRYGERRLSHRTPTFPIVIPAQSSQILYFSSSSPVLGNHIYEAKVFSQSEFDRQKIKENIGFSIIFSVLAIMMLYNLLLGITVRDSQYLLYVGFLATALLALFTATGLSFQVLWPNLPVITQRGIMPQFGLAMVASIQFGRSFLNLGTMMPRLNRFLFILIICLCLNMIPSFAGRADISVSLLFPMMAIGSISLIAAGAWVMRQGYRPARFYLLAHSALLLSLFIFALETSKVIPSTALGSILPFIGISAEVVLLSIGLADRINDTNSRFQKVQKEALAAQIEVNRMGEKMNHELEEKVELRTTELWRQTKGLSVMLDNINQGICVIDLEGVIQSQYSRHLEFILDRASLEGASLIKMLLGGGQMNREEQSMLISALEIMKDGELINFEMNAHLLPASVVYSKGKLTKQLEIDWAPIEHEDGKINRILAAIKDVTAFKNAEAEASEKRLELEAIGRILDISASKFRRFLKSASILIEESRQMLRGENIGGNWHVLLRNIHTIKGNARTYGLEDISGMVHSIESEIFPMDPRELGLKGRSRVNELLSQIEKVISFYRDIHDEKLKRGAAAEQEKLVVNLSTMITEIWGDIPSDKRKTFQILLSRIDDLNTNSFKKVLEPLISSVPRLAKQLAKNSPEVKISGVDFYIEPDFLHYYEDIFVHLMRNSLDHGFLVSDEGQIHIEIVHCHDNTSIIYRDNGRGLNLPILRQKAAEKRLVGSDADDSAVAHTIFTSGVSSASMVTEISGRGVGMDAVHGCVKRLKGSIEIRLLGESPVDAHKRFEFLIKLPPQNQPLKTLSLDFAA
ncbi:MAG TPA: 7TM diverse intracellular signaling domain-containing protein [Oligoflexus sp.]|uniref:7TM diverse intracellular signaling domain-containing protein n=1 Tax=Oligoflexus sp. TaxID=1971216 RepID=UPI002D45B602|nr:7TM diverse intracellular signaling domain-containing protein [Oligoflexus sp.]HYX38080.1 7TM diverse intracellular signaling domain-containing protein [Oligoflexus sp.]